MAVRRILGEAEEALRKRSREVAMLSKREWELLDDMAQTMYEADGVGLAAPQVGILKRMVVLDCGDGLLEMINPRVVRAEGEQDGAEGCLSLPGKRGMVCRPMCVTVEALDRHGKPFSIEGEGMLARCLCHEIDHLEGILYTDKMSRALTDAELKALSEEDDA